MDGFVPVGGVDGALDGKALVDGEVVDRTTGEWNRKRLTTGGRRIHAGW